MLTRLMPRLTPYQMLSIVRSGLGKTKTPKKMIVVGAIKARLSPVLE